MKCRRILYYTKVLFDNFLSDVTLTGHLQGSKEQVNLLWRLSSENGQKTFVLLSGRSLSSHIIAFRLVKDVVLVEVADKSREHRVQLVQQEDVVLTYPRGAFDVRVISCLSKNK